MDCEHHCSSLYIDLATFTDRQTDKQTGKQTNRQTDRDVGGQQSEVTNIMLTDLEMGDFKIFLTVLDK